MTVTPQNKPKLCEHLWMLVNDWEGDPSLPGGVREYSYYVCQECGEETDNPEEHEDE